MVAQDDSARVSLNIPTRLSGAMTGSQFGASIRDMPLGPQRELAIFQQFQLGNVPDFMRALCPVSRQVTLISGHSHTAVVWVTPDYLCVGTDEDYLRCPMNPLTATKVADLFGGFLITRALSNAIFSSADVRLIGKPMPFGPTMTSTRYFVEHNEMIQDQLNHVGATPGQLVAGHKKDVVLCSALFDGKPYPAGHSDRVAIYGWARVIESGRWQIWQGLNPDSHENTYADYSHGIRLAAGPMVVDGAPATYDQVLCDSETANTVSDENALKGYRYPHT